MGRPDFIGDPCKLGPTVGWYTNKSLIEKGNNKRMKTTRDSWSFIHNSDFERNKGGMKLRKHILRSFPKEEKPLYWLVRPDWQKLRKWIWDNKDDVEVGWQEICTGHVALFIEK